MCYWRGCPSQRLARALTPTASTSLGARMYASQTARSRQVSSLMRILIRIVYNICHYCIFKLSVNSSPLNFAGDDCMSIENGTHDLHVSKVVCGPGHGISIGSLGDDNSRAEVSGITIDSVQLYGTTNGARIKTYQGGSGYAKDITFQNMVMYDVKNPIIIDQNYCDKAKPCEAQGSAVEVSNVVFKNIRGTTTTKDAIKMNCSKNVPCQDITLQNINLKMQHGKGNTQSTCQNAKWRKSGTVLPQPCTGKS